MFTVCWVKVLSGLCVSASCGGTTVLRAAGFNITFAPGLMKCYLESAILMAARRKASDVKPDRKDWRYQITGRRITWRDPKRLVKMIM